MVSLLPERDRRTVDRLVRVAGSEEAFERAVYETRRRVGRTPKASEVLLTLLKHREQQLEQQIARAG